MDYSEIDPSFHKPWSMLRAYIDSVVPNARNKEGFLSQPAVFSLLDSVTDRQLLQYDFTFNRFHNVCVVAELFQEFNFIKEKEGSVMLFRYGRGMAERDEGPRSAEFTATGQLIW